MKRRQLLSGGAAGVLVGTTGCLGTGFRRGSTGEGTSECDRFEGEFGALSISVPAEPPDDATIVDLGNTALPSLEEVARELESARAQYGDAEETIDEYGLQSQRVGWVTLGNGDLYESVDSSLSDFETTDTTSPFDVWYAEYDEEVFDLTILRRDYPFGTPNADASTHVPDDPLEVTVTSGAPESADLIDAEEDLLPESEFFVTVLDVAQCDRTGTDFEYKFSSTMRYFIPHEETDLLTDYEMSEAGWYVEYEGEYYVFDIHFTSY